MRCFDRARSGCWQSRPFSRTAFTAKKVQDWKEKYGFGADLEADVGSEIAIYWSTSEDMSSRYEWPLHPLQV